jgi:hypothetical protein
MQESSVELQMRGISERCSNKTKKQRRTRSKEEWDAAETYIPPHVRGTLGKRILATAQKSFQYRKTCVSPHLRAHAEFLTLLTYEGAIRYIFDSRHGLYFKISCQPIQENGTTKDSRLSHSQASQQSCTT